MAGIHGALRSLEEPLASRRQSIMERIFITRMKKVFSPTIQTFMLVFELRSLDYLITIMMGTADSRLSKREKLIPSEQRVSSRRSEIE